MIFQYLRKEYTMHPKKVLYSHIGCGNRGCEASAKTISKILNCEKEDFLILSKNGEDEIHCGTEKYASVKRIQDISGIKPLSSLPARILKLTGIDKNATTKYLYNKVLDRIGYQNIFLSTGGDLYCYGPETQARMRYLNNRIRENGGQLYLWACSIEPSALTPEILEDLTAYHYIFARESITYHALQEKGIKNVSLFPDPAFILEPEKWNNPTFCESKNYIGFNYSSHTNGGIGEETENFQAVLYCITKLLEQQNNCIILIPHVYWKEENDLIILRKIKSHFSANNRVMLIEENLSASQLKYIIANCSLFVGARTHSVIAAYSSNVPTLALGYSVKSKGIAQDIFGSYEEYVLDMKQKHSREDLYNAVCHIEKEKDEIRNLLIQKQAEFTKKLEKQSVFCKNQLHM